ncbi:hypothetical protein KZ291_32235, partial [Escherichia coli]|nr:hypothetical protein [Escherichia coli]
RELEEAGDSSRHETTAVQRSAPETREVMVFLFYTQRQRLGLRPLKGGRKGPGRSRALEVNA